MSPRPFHSHLSESALLVCVCVHVRACVHMCVIPSQPSSCRSGDSAHFSSWWHRRLSLSWPQGGSAGPPRVVPRWGLSPEHWQAGRVWSVGDPLEMLHAYAARGPSGAWGVCACPHVEAATCVSTSYLCWYLCQDFICICVYIISVPYPYRYPHRYLHVCHASVCISTLYLSVSVAIIISKYLSHQDLVTK